MPVLEVLTIDAVQHFQTSGIQDRDAVLFFVTTFHNMIIKLNKVQTERKDQQHKQTPSSNSFLVYPSDVVCVEHLY